jgi:predicted dehydrogenase
VERVQADGGGVLGALGPHYIDWPSSLVRRCRHRFRSTSNRCGRRDRRRSNRIVKAETDDTFLFSLEFKNGGFATMVSSFAATPARGAKIVVMGDQRHADRGADRTQSHGGWRRRRSRAGSPLQELATPKNTRRSRMPATIA